MLKPSMDKEVAKAIKKNKARILHNKKFTKIDKLAIWITNHVGTMGFFFIIFIWTIIWLGWNMLVPISLRFDPYPGFILWLFISNMIQIFLMPLIMVGQNLQTKNAEARAEADFEINTKAEIEVERVIKHLEQQNEWILEILKEIKGKTK